MEFIEKLCFLINKKGITKKKFLEDIGSAKNSFAYWEKNGTIPNGATLQKIADYFNVSVDYLFSGKEEKTGIDLFSIRGIERIESMKKIPLLGEIACGDPILAVENAEEFCMCPDRVDADFCLRAKGDSMIDARICDGDIVYVRRQPIVENGEIAAVLIGEEATLKRVYLYPDTVVLQPANAAYQPLIYRKEEMNDVIILGKAVYFLSKCK